MADASRFSDVSCQRAFERGYTDAQHGLSDFVRRGYQQPDHRAAYMVGRAAYHADKLTKRGVTA